jgi:hypothetical protein
LLFLSQTPKIFCPKVQRPKPCSFENTAAIWCVIELIRPII